MNGAEFKQLPPSWRFDYVLQGQIANRTQYLVAVWGGKAHWNPDLVEAMRITSPAACETIIRVFGLPAAAHKAYPRPLRELARKSRARL